MAKIQLSVVHRLPRNYRWLPGFTGVKVEPILCNDVCNGNICEENNLVGFKLLSHNGIEAWYVMKQLHLSLQEIQVNCTVLEWEGEPCLFIKPSDESTALCRLKNIGAAIAEAIETYCY